MQPLRRAASALALLALLVIGLRPHWNRRERVAAAILVTPGADAATVRWLADSLGGAPVFHEAADVRRGPRFGRIHVVGWGLDPDAWHALDSIPVTFHPAPPAPGILRASWPATVPLGDELVVEGAVARVPAGARIALLDAGGVTDSGVPADAGTFRLATPTRALGRLLYVLRVSLRDRPVAQETLGVTVVAPPAPRLLVLEASPRFETRALRDWLGRRHGEVAVRSRVSRDRFHSEFVNRDSVSLTTISDRLLSQFDVVAVDGRSLAAMRPAERTTLREAVSKGGLAVLIEPDTVVFDSSAQFSDRRFFLDFAVRPVRGLDERSVRPVWTGLRRDERSVTALAADPYTLGERFGTESLIDDGTGGHLAQVTPRGAGRLGISLIRESSRWMRTGEHAAFSAYWSRLLAALAPGHTRRARWEITTPGPWLVHRPLGVSVDGAGDHLVTTVAASGMSDSVWLARDEGVSGSWRGVFWPRAAGWHAVDSPEGLSIYVQAASSTTWLSRRSGALLDASARFLVESGARSGGPDAAPTLVSSPIPPVWGFSLFLVCVAVLWSKRRAG
ncbi:MAG TPA: hypothetical protein VLB49_02260 [Gemmatimonadales bacterium]|nr:hypothetical protein [Gemmatimonadales bacterium]